MTSQAEYLPVLQPFSSKNAFCAETLSCPAIAVKNNRVMTSGESKPKRSGTSFRYKLVSCIFVLLSRKSDQCAIQARLGVASHLSTTPRWGNPAKCFSQRHNKLTRRLALHTVPLMLSVKQGRCE